MVQRYHNQMTVRIPPCGGNSRTLELGSKLTRGVRISRRDPDNPLRDTDQGERNAVVFCSSHGSFVGDRDAIRFRCVSGSGGKSGGSDGAFCIRGFVYGGRRALGVAACFVLCAVNDPGPWAVDPVRELRCGALSRGGVMRWSLPRSDGRYDRNRRPAPATSSAAAEFAILHQWMQL